MSKYKVGDKVVLEITDKIEVTEEPWYILSDATSIFESHLDNAAEPLSTYTEPLERKNENKQKQIEKLVDKLHRQAAEITRLLAEKERLKAENEKMSIKIDAYELCGDQHEVEYNQAFNQGAEMAWELARKITCQPINGGFNRSEFEKIFGYGYISDIFEKYKYTEAAAKVAEWEKTRAKILVKAGDVLENIYDSNVKCIVTNLYPNNKAYLVFDDGTAGMNELDNFKKTGRHIDIDGFLKQIGGEVENG